MKDYVRLENNAVVEFLTIQEGQDITQMFPPIFTWVEITGVVPRPDYGWTYDGSVFSAPVIPEPSSEELALVARIERERLLRTTYDPGIMMALRALRRASTPEQEAYAQGKIVELDNYAEALISIPDQVGFPQTITWPTAPTK